MNPTSPGAAASDGLRFVRADGPVIGSLCPVSTGWTWRPCSAAGSHGRRRLAPTFRTAAGARGRTEPACNPFGQEKSVSEAAKYRATGRSMNNERPYAIEFEMDPDDPATEAEIRAVFADHVIAKVKDEVGTVPAGVRLLLDPRTVQVERLAE